MLGAVNCHLSLAPRSFFIDVYELPVPSSPIRGIFRFCLAVVIAAVVFASPAHAQDSFSIEDILSAPFPSELVSAPSGDRVAWVQNAEGVRSIWTAEGPSFEGRKVYSAPEDDGQRVGDLDITPGGDRIVYVRGGYPNRQGEHPNPLSRPEWPDRALWIVGVNGGSPRRLAEGHAPSVSPSGDRVVYLKDGDVWSVSLGTNEAKPAALLGTRGSAEELRWSPNGNRLAFVSDRGDHSFVGVYTFADSSLQYLDPSVDQDSNPVWSPDGSRIAFLRIPNEEEDLPFMPEREALPWSIRVANVETAEGREVWSAKEGRGSAFQGINADNQLFWTSDGRIVFPWERTGWLHLYSVPVGGGEATALTAGAFEVQFVTMTPDRNEIVFASNQDDRERRHLWRVSSAEGPPERLTSGTGIEWSPVVTAESQAIAFLASGARQPAHAEVLRPDGERERMVSGPSEDFPNEELVEPTPVSFSATDGKEIRGQLFRPPTLQPDEQRPAVIFFHGGSRRQMLRGFHYRGYYHNAYALNQYLANQGYVVLAVNYRSGIGYGLEFREALNYGARGASEFNDVMGAGLYLQNRRDVDPERIGLWGGSYGGYLTALGLARASDLFAAGVDLHGVHDWNVVIENFVPSYDPTKQEEAARLARESSPIADVETWRSPVLLIHGDDDRNVPFSETVTLVEQLRKHDVPFEQLIFPDEVHGFLLHQNWLRAYRATADFFDRKLKSDD